MTRNPRPQAQVQRTHNGHVVPTIALHLPLRLRVARYNPQPKLKPTGVLLGWQPGPLGDVRELLTRQPELLLHSRQQVYMLEPLRGGDPVLEHKRIQPRDIKPLAVVRDDRVRLREKAMSRSGHALFTEGTPQRVELFIVRLIKPLSSEAQNLLGQHQLTKADVLVPKRPDVA